MYILWPYMAYSTTTYCALWEVFRYQKRTTVCLGVTWLSWGGSYPRNLQEHLWWNSEYWPQNPWSGHRSYTFLTIIPLFQHSIIPCGWHKKMPLKTLCFNKLYNFRDVIMIFSIKLHPNPIQLFPTFLITLVSCAINLFYLIFPHKGALSHLDTASFKNLTLCSYPRMRDFLQEQYVYIQ